MHVTLVHIHVKPEHVDKFIAVTQVNHEHSIHESGNHRFDVLQDPDHSTHFILYEAYASAEDAAAHKQTPHYIQWRDTVAEMMSLPREGKRMNALFPSF
jgi:autoinducer 2-degrading protein